MWLPRFASHLNFLDPQLTDNGKPFGPIRYKQIVRDCYLISKNLNTSYNELLEITPTEREYLLEFLDNDARKQQEMIENSKQQSKLKHR